MKLNNLSRLTALLLALTIFMTSVAFADSVAVSGYTADDYASQLQAAYIAAYSYDGTADVGKYAKFAESEDFIFVYDNDPDLSDDPYSFAYEECLEDASVRITDWAWMSSTSALLYKVEFYRGGVIEEAADDWPAEAWVLQCYTEDSNEFPFLEFVTICEDCGEPDCNIDHKPPTEAVIPEEPTLTEGEAVSLVDANGEPITNGEILRIKEGTKYSLSAWTGLEDHGDETYQWQISAKETGGVWVNISGQTSKGLLTSLAMFEAAFRTVPYIRCKITTGGQTLYSQAIPVAALAEATLTDSNSDVSVAGLLPLDATLNVTSTSLEETGLDNGAYPVGEASLFSDVTLYRAGSTYQPEEDETVTVTFPEAAVTEAGLSAGDGYHIYHIHDGAVDISGIQQYNGGDIAMTFGSLSVVGISETTQAEQSLVDEHGEMTPGYFDGYKVGTFNSDSVVLYDTPDETNYLSMTTITGYSGAEVEFGTYYTYKDGFVVYEIQATNNTPEELKTTLEYYCYVSAADITISGETEEPEVINTCAICGTENCTTQHLYCEEHSKFDCTENHEKAEPTKPLTGAVIPENLTFTPDADVCIADAKGNKVTSSFELPAGTQASLSAWPAGDAYQWQIKDKDDNWMDIRGKDQQGLLFSGALFADANAQPVIRCEVTVGGEVKHSAEIRVNVTTPAADASLLSVARAADPVVTAEGDNLREYTVVINYVFEDNKVVAEPYTATLAAGSNWPATVKNPTVMGYLPYVGNATEPSESVELNITNIQADVTYTVTYKPTNVNYTVIHYWQNVDNDDFTERERVELQGLTGSTVPEVANAYPGMYALLYERPAIAADGTTVIEVYYDRNYYLMLFELDGGYGVEPIYARYGADIGDVGTPTKAGYSFLGWSLDGSTIVDLPETMPAGSATYKAVWQEDELVKVHLVFWGENANDSEYSPLEVSSGQDYFMAKPGATINYSTGNIVCGYTTEHSHTADCYGCGLEEHTHSADCCEITAHTHGANCCTIEAHTHTDGCCSIAVHTHSTGCYAGVGAQANGWGRPNNPAEGQVDEGWAIGSNPKYIYIKGTWYNYTGSTADGQIAPTTCGQTEGSHADHTCVYDKCGYNYEHTHGTGNCVYCTEPEHTHGEDSCIYCDQQEHTHVPACLTCPEYEHRHSATCYITNPGVDGTLWEYKTSDTVTVAADGSTVMNVYYDRVEYTFTFRVGNSTIHSFSAKWGENIREKWTFTGTNGTKYSPENKDSWEGNVLYEERIYMVEIMPARNITFTRASGNNTSNTFHYYVESVENVAGENKRQFESKYYDFQFQLVNDFGRLYYDEDFFELEGFTRYKSARANGNEYPLSNNGTSPINNLYFYYTRNRYDIEFYNPTDLIKTNEDVPYGAPLAGYNWTPDSSYAPTSYAPGSVQFAGWYLNPECSEGHEYDLTTHTMPVGSKNGEVSLRLYAKWEPIPLTVEFYLDKNALDAGTKLSTHPDVTVDYGAKVTPIPANPTNGSYTFVNWFYIEDGEEKAFDFANMPITKHLQVYGKWSSKVLKEYIVYFKIQGTNTEIADPITGSTMAGETKTFDAKGDEELYPDYQVGYFPLVKSHSMTLDIDTPENANGTEWVEITNADGTKKIVQSFTFEYVQKDAVPYTVYYVAETLKAGEDATKYQTITRKNDKGVDTTYYIIADTEQHDGNRKAVVTEQFKTVQGYMPDAYQKRLVVDGSDGAENEIIFYYTVDTEHAYYKITHLTQNTDGENWTEYKSSQAPGVIGETDLNADSFDEHIDGFTFKIELTEACVGNETTVVGGNNVTLTAAGLELKLYYLRNSYPYEVRYLEEGTGDKLAEPKKGSGLFGEVKSESAIAIQDYTAVKPTSQNLTIKIEESQTEAKLNIITFYYTENEVTINYVPVGPVGATNFGSVDPTSETIKVLSGTAQGSTATAKEHYTFDGWYRDEACTEANLLTTEKKYVPEKVDGKNVEATYYAKFVENEVTINYVPVGPKDATNFGTVDPTSETIKILTGTAHGSTATATTPTYKFVGWYSEEACINQLSAEPKYVPTKENDATWVDGTTYYAKFDWNVGQLQITKNVNYPNENYKELFKEDVFTFTVALGDNTINGEYGAAKFVNGVATITLKAGETATISNLVHDTTYTVTEDAAKMPAGYFFKEATNADNSKIVAGQTVIASFTNEYKVGSLTISKEVVGDAGVVPGDEFEFTVQLSNKQDEYSFTGSNAGTISHTDNTVTLKAGESITITGIPLGTEFTVTEKEIAGYTPTEDVISGNINTTSEAKFTNTYQNGDLQITKQVVNNTTFAPVVSDFTIQVKLEGVGLAATYPVEGLATGKPVTWSVDGNTLTALIPVTAPQTVTIKHLPDGTKYTVTEVAPAGYTAEIQTVTDNNKSGAIDAGKADAVTVINTYKTGSLEVTKTVIGEVTEEYPSAFNFTLVLSDDVPVEDCKIQIAGGEVNDMSATGQFTLTTGQTALITGIPDSVTYTVTENDTATDGKKVSDYYTTTVNGTASATMNANAEQPVTIEFVNTAKTSNLTVIKNGMSSSDESAIVKVTVAGETYTVVLNSDNGWNAVIAGLPIGAEYSATETSWAWRYDGTVSTGGTVNKTEGVSQVTVTNRSNGDKWLHDENRKTNNFN